MIKSILKGIVIGIANIIPGVSGGTMAVSMGIYDKLIHEIASNEKVCKYIDMPVQHGDDSILKLMGRKTNSAEIKEKIQKLRQLIPDIAIRTSIIVGFPGEDEKASAPRYRW